MMRLVPVYLVSVGAGLLLEALGSETLIMLAIVGVVALIIGMVAMAWPGRPPRQVDVYRKDDLDWPDELPMIEAEWRPVIHMEVIHWTP